MDTLISSSLIPEMGSPIRRRMEILAHLTPQEVVDKCLEKREAKRIATMKRGQKLLAKVKIHPGTIRRVHEIAQMLSTVEMDTHYSRKEAVRDALREWSDAKYAIFGERPDAKTVLAMIRY